MANSFKTDAKTRAANRKSYHKVKDTSKYKDYRCNWHLMKTYGITLEEYDQMFEDQGGGCAFCGGLNDDGRRLHVDHNHETGKVRGLLCLVCNTKLGWYEGWYKENRDRVLEYLEEYDDG